MRKWQVLVLGAVLTGCNLGVDAAELNIAAFNMAWAGTSADFDDHIRVCTSAAVNWCDTRAKIAAGSTAPTAQEKARAGQCQAAFDQAAGGAAKGMLIAPCNAYKLTASKWKKGPPDIYSEKLEGLRKTVDELIRVRGMDVIAFQEVRSVALLTEILGTHFKDFDSCVANHTSFQTVGFAWRKTATSKPGQCALESSLSVKEDPSDPQSSRYLRPGLALTLSIGEETVTLMNVHLKSSCANLANSAAFRGHALTDPDTACKVLNRQVAPLESWIERLAAASPLFVVLGDFNRRLDEEAARSIPPNEVRLDRTDPASPNTTGPNGEVLSRFLWQELSDGNPGMVQIPHPSATECKGFEGLDHILISVAFNSRQVGPLQSEKLKVFQKNKQVIETSDHCPRTTKLAL